MAFLNESDRARIAAAVRAAEAKTSGELVTVIARAADPYLHVPLLWAAWAALLAPAVLWLTGAWLSLPVYYAAQLATFVGVFALCQWPPLKLRLVPRRLKRARAARLAREQFFTRGLHRTRERTGVLIFVCVAERYVEIIGDEGIHKRVPGGYWDGIVAQFVQQVRAGRVADGFVSAISACGDQLAAHFPRAADDRNELPDRLIEI